MRKLMSRLIPESPSWLLVKGRTKEALDQLERVARCNKADLQVQPASSHFLCLQTISTPVHIFEHDDYILKENEIARELEKERQIDVDNPVAKATLLQMFKTENLRLNAFLCTVIW